MPLLANLLIATAKMISMIANIYIFIIIISAIMSWFRPDPYNPIVKLIHSLTEPLFYKIRKRLPRFLFQSGIDFTPLIVILVLVFLENLIAGTLLDYGLSLKYGRPHQGPL